MYHYCHSRLFLCGEEDWGRGACVYISTTPFCKITKEEEQNQEQEEQGLKEQKGMLLLLLSRCTI